MNQSNTLSVHLKRSEAIGGWIYLPFYLIILSTLIALVMAGMGYDLNDKATQIQTNLIYGLINFAAIAVIFHHFLIQNLINIGHRFWGFIQSTILGFILYWIGTMLIGYLLAWINPNLTNVNNDTIASMVDVNYKAMMIYTIALVPVVEESLFRGLIFSTIHKKHRIAAYIVSALAFASIHVIGYIGTQPVATLLLCYLEYLPAGIALGWAYERADSIWAPIAIHAVINTISMLSLDLL